MLMTDFHILCKIRREVELHARAYIIAASRCGALWPISESELPAMYSISNTIITLSFLMLPSTGIRKP